MQKQTSRNGGRRIEDDILLYLLPNNRNPRFEEVTILRNDVMRFREMQLLVLRFDVTSVLFVIMFGGESTYPAVCSRIRESASWDLSFSQTVHATDHATHSPACDFWKLSSKTKNREIKSKDHIHPKACLWRAFGALDSE
jgi:hypothetical protein